MNAVYWLILTFLTLPIPFYLLSTGASGGLTLATSAVFSGLTIFSSILSFKQKKYGLWAAGAVFFMSYLLITLYYVRIY